MASETPAEITEEDFKRSDDRVTLAKYLPDSFSCGHGKELPADLSDSEVAPYYAWWTCETDGEKAGSFVRLDAPPGEEDASDMRKIIEVVKINAAGYLVKEK